MPHTKEGTMKIILTSEDVKQILLREIFLSFRDNLHITTTSEIEFNEWNLPYGDLIFEKKKPENLEIVEVEK
jgi:hypothetical protein